MTGSLQMPWLTVRSQTRPIHIRLTRESLVVSVNVDKLSRDLFMRVSWEREFKSWLKSWKHPYPRHNKHLIVSWNGTLGLHHYRHKKSLRMRAMASSLGWTVAAYP